MPIFEMDPAKGSATVVEPLQPAAGSFEAEATALVTAHLPAILGERLLAVAQRRPGGDDPLLIAIDQDGRPLVVDVCAVLDPETLVRALRHAGMVARLTTDELGRLYVGGADAFVTDLLSFRDSLPASVANGAEERRGTRLVLLCADVDEAVADAVTFLRHGSSRVEVLQVGVVRGAEGRRLLEVVPLTTPVHVRRAAEPSALRLVKSHDAFAAAMAYDVQKAHATRRGPAGRRAVSDGEIDEPSTAVAARAQVASGGGSVRVPTAITPVEFAAPGHPAGDGQVASFERRSPTGAIPLAPPVPPASVRAPAAVTAAPIAPPAPPVLPGTPASTPAPSVPTRVSVTSQRTVANPYSPEAFVPPVADPAEVRHSRLASAATPLSPAEPAMTPAPAGTEPDALLAEVARELAEAIELVWIRERRGERLTATLRQDGLIQLPDGSIYADPSAAAGAASGSVRPVDGWRVWHLGDEGPSLVEIRGL